MPELPEVETIRIQLEKAIVGKKIAKVEVLREKSFQGNPEEIIGKKISGIKRRAKLLIFELEDNVFLLTHLKLTGQFIYKTKNEKRKTKNESPKFKRSRFDITELPGKYTRVIIDFADGSHLYFNDLRLFGWMKIEKISNIKYQISKYGPEPFSKAFSLDYFEEILSNWGRPVKLLLMDQEKIAGIGNIYANEALFCAKIAPHHRGRELVKDHPEKVKKLYECIKKVLKMGLRYQGATAPDDAYRNIEGEKGRMQEHFMVYRRDGQNCLNKCGGVIRRMTLGGRGTFFCPRCQK